MFVAVTGKGKRSSACFLEGDFTTPVGACLHRVCSCPSNEVIERIRKLHTSLCRPEETRCPRDSSIGRLQILRARTLSVEVREDISDNIIYELESCHVSLSSIYRHLNHQFILYIGHFELPDSADSLASHGHLFVPSADKYVLRAVPKKSDSDRYHRLRRKLEAVRVDTLNVHSLEFETAQRKLRRLSEEGSSGK